MNFLFHMILSGEDEQILTGNFMGDFVKGPLTGLFPPRVLLGLRLHRKIDSFAQKNDSFRTSMARLSPHFGLYRGVLVDLFYDHFLAIEWHSWSEKPLAEYLAWSRRAVENHRTILPPKLQELVPVIFEQLLPSYAETKGIESALVRMSRRIPRPTPLAEGRKELLQHYVALKADFESFIVTAMHFSADAIREDEFRAPR
jgi:acyl carrier protein phosphodiesterase